MDRKGVQSTDIRSIGYEKETLTLEVEFWSGGIYLYYGVPEGVYQAFMHAVSKGSYFRRYIQGTYRFCRVG